MRFINLTPAKWLGTGIAAASVLALASCGPLVSLGGDSKPPTLYGLAFPERNADMPTLPTILLVEEPETSDALDSRRMALKPGPLEFKYYANARWTDRAPRLLQDLLISGLNNVFADVGTNAMPITPNYRLQSRLVNFQTEYDGGNTPVAKVTMELKLFSTSPLALIGTTTIHGEEAATSDRIDPISRAFNQAAQEVTAEAVTWAHRMVADHLSQSENGNP